MAAIFHFLKGKTRRTSLFMVPLFLIALSAFSLPAAAINYGSGLYGSCQYGSCSITIGSAGTVALNVTPNTNGACTIQQDTVSVFTDNSNGFTLSLTNSSTNTALLSGAATINASGASQASPAALVANTWGYRVDGVGGFGAGPTTTQTNIGLNATTFAPVPASNASPDTLANTAAPADPTVNTPVWYGVCANTSVKSGTYTTQVTYTAITN